MSFGAISIAATVAGIGASIGGSILEGNAQKAALKSRAAAIQSLETLDIDELKKLVEDTDLEHYRRTLAAQREIDPALAALRDEGSRGLLSILAEDRETAQRYSPALRRSLEDLLSGDPRRIALINMLTDRAEQDLKAGATLPPEFQAETIRAGLEAASAGGLSPEGRGATGANLRRLLGAEGLALQQAREAAARQNLQAADALRAGRLSLLQGLVALDEGLRQARAGRLAGAFSTGQSSLVPIGMTGREAAQLSIQNTELENKKRLALGDIKAAQKLAEGSMFSSILGGVAGGLMDFAGGLNMGGLNAGRGMLNALGSLLPSGSLLSANAYGAYLVNPVTGSMTTLRSPAQALQYNAIANQFQ